MPESRFHDVWHNYGSYDYSFIDLRLVLPRLSRGSVTYDYSFSDPVPVPTIIPSPIQYRYPYNTSSSEESDSVEDLEEAALRVSSSEPDPSSDAFFGILWGKYGP